MRYSRLKLLISKHMDMFSMVGNTFKKGDFNGALREILAVRRSFAAPHGAMMDDYIFSEENYWLNKTDRNVIFPESEVDIKNLLTGEYDLDDDKGFNFPMSSFVVALPSGFEFEGVKLPSFMVTYMPTVEHVSTVTNGLMRDFHLPEGNIMVKPIDRDKDCLAIVIPTEDGEFSRVMMHQPLVPLLLKSKSIKDYQGLVGSLSDETFAIDLDEYESSQQFLALKLVSALSAYVSANDEAALSQGMRDPKARDTLLPKGIKKVKSYTYRTVLGRDLKEKKKWSSEPATQLFVSRKSNTWNIKKITPTDFGELH